MTEYIINTTHFARFNALGEVIVFSNQGFGYVYETSCGLFSNFFTVHDDRNKTSHYFDLSISPCLRLHYYLYKRTTFRFINQYRYQGPLGDFCFGQNYVSDFPILTKTPKEYKNFRIVAEMFHIRTPSGPVFKSPTIADYKRFVRKKLPLLQITGKSDDYFYEYWDDANSHDASEK